jgi:hypothetical protein
MGRSQQLVSWHLESGRDVKIKSCVSGKGLFLESQVLSEDKVLCTKVRGKLLNRNHVGRRNDHHQRIMKSERMKNHGAHITYTLQLLSAVLYTPRSVPVARMCCENIRLASKSKVTMDSVSHGMIPALLCLVINSGFSACIMLTNQVYALSVILPTSPDFLMARKSIALSCITDLG